MVSCDWTSDGSVGVLFRHGMVSGLWGELVLFQGVVMKFKDKIMLQGCREPCCEYGPSTRILYCAHDLLGKSHMTRLFGLMNSKVDSRYGDP